MTARPLAGIRVLDLSRLLPGPWCTQLLADLGADVIKVETPTAGDYARMAPPELGFGGLFASVNRGKRSIAVNHRVPAGRDVVLRLARDADVFLESSRPGQMARRGLGPVDLHLVNPRIVYCSLSGYGQTGPYRDRPGHDLDYLAVAGLLGLLSGPDRSPIPPGIQLADLAGGTLAALEIVAALVARERTGRGAALDVAVLDAVVAWLAPLGESARRPSAGPGPLAGTFPCYHVYACSDGEWLAVAALEPQFWVAACRAFDREDLVPRQFDATAVSVVAGILATRPRHSWLACLPADACAAPVNRPDEAERDAQVRARGLVRGNGQGVTVHALPDEPDRDGRHRRHRSDRVPGLGEHTRTVLSAAGWSAHELAELEAAGTISGPASPEKTARAARLGALLARMAERSAGAPAATGTEPTPRG
jgi:crotonobetainyl-CoA:carnitine CoA-transferase CaiB-like acyl-CoA transferase